MLLSFGRQKKVTKENSRLDSSITQHQLCRYVTERSRHRREKSATKALVREGTNHSCDWHGEIYP